ncbi:MAG: PilZ domain-containing protein [Bdellovibrionota bacterium]|nr:PilZ domain-containing protein [Bdellovibrionota bacterium]
MGDQVLEPRRRIPLSFDVTYRKSYSRRFDRGCLRNISLTGAFIEDPEAELKQDDKINLSFELAGRKRKIAAKIVWVGDEGAGVNFIHSNNQDEQLIDDLMFYVEESKDEKRGILNLIFDKIA